VAVEDAPEETDVPHWRHNRETMLQRLRGGRSFGYLAYVDGWPADWVNASLRADYTLHPSEDEDPPGTQVIGISCFIIAPPYRRHGMPPLCWTGYSPTPPREERIGSRPIPSPRTRTASRRTHRGALLQRANGSRIDRHAAGRIVRRLAKRAGIDKPISPHSLRHAAITAALDAGCSLRDVQDFARHVDPRQTRRYDRVRGALDRDPTYIVATYLAGATGAR
jgi:hypothetical protein